MLPLIASKHVYRLLDQVEVVLVIARGRGEVKVPVYKGLRARIEQSVYVTLIPSALLNRLEFAIEII